MLSLQQLLGKDVKSFALMEASAEAARGSILGFIDQVKSSEGTRSLAGFVEARLQIPQ